MDSRHDEDLEGGSGPDSGLDLRYYWTVIKKRRWIIVGTMVVVTALAIVVTMQRPKIYTAAATVVVDPQAPRVLGAHSVEVVPLGSGNSWVQTDYYNTQHDIITSRSLARQTVRKFQLHRDPRLVPRPPPAASEDDLVDMAAARVQGRVSARLKKDSRIFVISVRDTDPKLAAELANHVADTYIEQNLAVKHDVTSKARGWVAKQLDEARSELDRSETALIAYKENNNILSVSLEDRLNMLSKALETFHGALTEAQKARIDLQVRRRAVAQLLSGDVVHASSSLIPESSPIGGLRTLYLEERRKLRALEERYGPKHPEVVAQKTRVDAALADLKAEAQSTMKAMDAEISAFRDAEQKYSAEIERLTQETFELNKRAKEYKRLSREAESAEANYQQLLRRLTESGLQAQDHSNNIRLLDEARAPRRPVEPNLRTSAVLGLSIGLMLALALAFFVEFLDRSVKSQEDIESAVGLPFLGLVPSVDPDEASGGNQPELYIARHPTSTVAECCRVVRTNILFCSPDKPLSTLVVTSSNPVEGKTMTVVNLGIVMAQSGHRTVLVDTDMRRPRLHKALGASNENGVSRVILGEADLDSAIKTTEVPNLFLLPCGPIPPNPAELLQTEKFTALMETLRSRFDRVIFDSPPVLAVTDAVVLSRLVDGAVLVVRAGRTSRDAVTRAKRSIRGVNGNIVGVVLNDVNLKNPHYSYYYNYYQYKYHEAPAAASPAQDASTKS